jgi:hypothetical protein
MRSSATSPRRPLRRRRPRTSLKVDLLLLLLAPAIALASGVCSNFNANNTYRIGFLSTFSHAKVHFLGKICEHNF